MNKDNYSKKKFDKIAEKKGNIDNKAGSGGNHKPKADFCPIFSKCGGCQIEGSSYMEQLKKKEKQIRKVLDKYGTVQPIIAMQPPFHYRNNVQAIFDRDKFSHPISGIYQPGTRYVVPIDRCMLNDEKADEIIGSIRGLLKSFKIRTYDEGTGYGLLRHVLVKKGVNSHEILVVLVTASPVFPSKNNFIAAVRKLHPEITTMVQNINGRDRSRVLGDNEKTLYGKGYIEDTFCGYSVRITSKSKSYVNMEQKEIVYKKALKAAGLTGKETVLDIGCGMGIMSVMAASQAKCVIGLDTNRDAIREAIGNAKKNNSSAIKFFSADAGQFLKDMTSEGERADTIFLKPARGGCGQGVMDSIGKVGAETVVYVSEDLQSMERDLEELVNMGFLVKGVWGVDVAPFMVRVEAIILLHRRNKVV